MRLKLSLFFLFCVLTGSTLLAQDRPNGEVVSKTQTVNSECTNCPILVSQTVATEPGFRNRRTIGVGEEVTISLIGGSTLNCGNAQWTLEQQVPNDVGMLSSSVGQSVMFTAGINGGIAIIRATFPLGTPCSNLCNPLEIRFNVTIPSEVIFERKDDVVSSTGIICGPFLHAANAPSIGFRANQYLLPDNVNFYNISTAEGYAPSVFPSVPSPNYFANVFAAGWGNDHPADSFVPNTNEVIPNKGTKISSLDLIIFIGPCVDIGSTSGMPNPTPYVPADIDGIFYYDIPWSYQRNDLVGVATGVIEFEIIRQGFRHQEASETTSAYKKSATGSAIISAPTTPCMDPSNACN